MDVTTGEATERVGFGAKAEEKAMIAARMRIESLAILDVLSLSIYNGRSIKKVLWGKRDCLCLEEVQMSKYP